MQIGRVACHGIISDTEATRTCGTEGGADRVEQGHVADQQENDIQNRHAHIEQIENACGLAHFGHQLANAGTGAFCPQQMHGKTLALIACEGQQKHQNTHAAQPVAEAAPVEKTSGERLHIGQNGRAGGGEAGNNFKEGIDVGGDFPGNVKGEATDQTQYNPADTDTNQTFFGVKGAGRFAAEQKQQRGQYDDQSHGEDKCLYRRAFSAEKADQQGWDHKKSFDGKDLGDKPPHHFIIHRYNLIRKYRLTDGWSHGRW